MKRLREKRGLRLLVLGLLGALIIPLLAFAFASPARADEDDTEDYSLYRLSTNAAMYFSQQNSPTGGEKPADRMTGAWGDVVRSPTAGGDLLGYADPEFSVFNVVGWLFSQVSGSSQTMAYSTLKADDGSGGNLYSGMLDYAHFGAANLDLGLDSMSSGISGQIMSGIGGSLMWVGYALALAASMAFWVVIQILKLLNPFMWFYTGLQALSPVYAEALASGDTTMIDGPLKLLIDDFVKPCYEFFYGTAKDIVIPGFFASTILGALLFKKINKGGAAKKFIVRLSFLVLGLPLLGSMYTAVLNQFNDKILSEHSGPTRVILMTYVDFESWASNDRLSIPAAAKIGWAKDQASTDAIMSVRTSALAINKQTHGEVYADIKLPGTASSAHDAWKSGTPGREDQESNTGTEAVFTTFGMLTRYLASSTVAASDFESKIKEAIGQLPPEVANRETKKKWFIDKAGYGDEKGFGEEDPYPNNHPVLWAGEGLKSSSPGGDNTVFTTNGDLQGCGSRVWEEGPVQCNLTALSMYNYLNTGFGSDSLTMYSSNNATSGFTRENHMAISQVGTGPSKFMYWHNSLTVLGAIAILGFWYAIGMLAGSIKRTFSLVAAIPLATLGAISSISKVIVYSVAMVLEILVTLYMYQFVSELIITLPDIIAGPIQTLVTSDKSPLAGPTLGGIVVVILTLISSLLIMGVAIALLRVRKVVLKAMDEAFTKLVDKFMEPGNTPPAPKTGGGGLAPALASGAGKGAGQALAGKLGGGKMSGAMKGMGGKGPTNAGGLNASATLGVPSGPSGGDGPPGDGGGDDGPHGGHRGHEDPRTGSSDGDDGSPLSMNGSKPGSSQSDKEIANDVKGNGGLRNFGYNTDGKAVGTSEARSKSASDGGKAGAGIAGSSGGGGGSSSGTSGSGRSGFSTSSSAVASGSGSGSSGLSSSGHGAQFGYNSSEPAAVESSTNAVASSSSGHAFPSGSGTRSGGRGAPTNILSHSAPQKQLGNERPLQKNPRPTNPPKQPQQPQQPPEPRQPQGGNRQPAKAPQAPVGQPERRPRGSQPRPQR